MFEIDIILCFGPSTLFLFTEFMGYINYVMQSDRLNFDGMPRIMGMLFWQYGGEVIQICITKFMNGPLPENSYYSNV